MVARRALARLPRKNPTCVSEGSVDAGTQSGGLCVGRLRRPAYLYSLAPCSHLTLNLINLTAIEVDPHCEVIAP